MKLCCDAKQLEGTRLLPATYWIVLVIILQKIIHEECVYEDVRKNTKNTGKLKGNSLLVISLGY